MTVMPTLSAQQPRAVGGVEMSVAASPRGTALKDLRHSGSLRMLFPRSTVGVMPGVLINTSGGVTGGDRFRVDVTAKKDAELTLTTQAAERAYQAQPGQTGRVSTRLEIERGAQINWLPQETILFNGCDLDRSLTVNVAEGGSFLWVEPLVFGRAAMGERVTHGRFRDRIEIRRMGSPLYVDRVFMTGDVAAHLSRARIGNGAGAMATLGYVHPAAEAVLEPIRALLPETAGASLIREDMLVARILAPDSHLLRRTLIPAIRLLTKDDPPRPWMI